ncbi:hypothetical protein KL930_001511 [Ogataea haglerorum]|uniref:Uncharacterized protein n=1 Tax=Ogataea haglerorum TaxID=1937702 RepID=A0AAN6HYJ6_9ASCO|nr:uncharacterized protein KL911_004357 [Ogataea haglerorum]KAG7692127.1 hypothetical protein KL915_004887 [Ogataea haglerorum]KAG7698733.1 hypothetical protein KL951_001997 [Ogataea haglerorum]KAG7703621.1 hypothetical protein KL914_004578 [Ogataea haglerorum]KAG7704132.1 hypothetical protein KL950_004459 [Ogataea haglerorum]KAG7713967.1 hypothetical protein KL913_004658 [Ogataea haglerorum]
MSAFNDYCLVCEKICTSNSVYCSEECRVADQQQTASPTLSTCSSVQSAQTSNFNSIPTIISPVLAPQYNYVPVLKNTSSLLKSPPVKDLSYESPLLASISVQNDLDSNRLDLNATRSIAPLNVSEIPRSQICRTTAQNVSDLLSSTPASENYKKWLSNH